MENITEIPIFFIMGRPRSGTTLLRTLFDAHPNVKIPTEFPIFLFLYQRFKKVKDWDEATILTFIDHVFRIKIFNHRPIDTLKIDRQVFTEDLLKLAHKGTIQDFLKEFNFHGYSMFPKGEILHVGDKNPLYSIYIHRFIRIFPEAKFICIIRDYRDNYVSMRNLKDLKLEAPILPLQVYRWRYVAKRFRRYEMKYPGRFHLVRYEDLVTSQESIFRELCSFIGIPYDQNVFNFFLKLEENRDQFPRELVEKYHKSLINPVNKSRMGIWKKELTDDQVRMADRIAGKTADLLDYERKYRSFSLSCYVRSRPMVWYGYLIFRLMILGSYLPYRLGRSFFLNLNILVRVWHRIWGRKKEEDQIRK